MRINRNPSILTAFTLAASLLVSPTLAYSSKHHKKISRKERAVVSATHVPSLKHSETVLEVLQNSPVQNNPPVLVHELAPEPASKPIEFRGGMAVAPGTVIRAAPGANGGGSPVGRFIEQGAKEATHPVEAARKVEGNVRKNASAIANQAKTDAGNGAETVKQNLNRAEDDARRNASDAANTIKDNLEKFRQQATHAANISNADLSNLNNALNKLGSDLANSVNKAGDDVDRAVRHSADDIVETVKKANGDTFSTIKKANGDLYTTTQKATGDIITTYQKADSDTVETVRKGWRDIGEQAKRDAGNVMDARSAIERYVGRETESLKQVASETNKSLSSGHIVDAVWKSAVKPFQNTSHNAGKLAQESSIVNTIAQVAASAYGGPYGAAAYAAWFTYEQTGDADLALRVGIITGVSAAAGGKINAMPSTTTPDYIKKVVLAGAVGGLAVQAAGGDSEAIKNGFLASASMVIIQDGYKKYTLHELDGKSSTDDAYCMSSMGEKCSPEPIAYKRDAQGRVLSIDEGKLDASGNKIFGRLDESGNYIDENGQKILVDGQPKGEPQVDVRLTRPDRPHLGRWAAVKDKGLASEQGPLMTGVSRIPGMNGMSLLHDHFAVTENLGVVATIATIPPATVITYWGYGAPFYENIQRTSVKHARSQHQALQAIQESKKQAAAPK